MKKIPIVTDHQIAVAEEIEKTLLETRDDSGIDFVGVEVNPTTGKYTIFVGANKRFDKRTIELACNYLLSNIIELGIDTELKVVRGKKRP